MVSNLISIFIFLSLLLILLISLSFRCKFYNQIPYLKTRGIQTTDPWTVIRTLYPLRHDSYMIDN